MSTLAETNSSPLAEYYRWHARIYDATRWAFLFGRKRIIRLLPERRVPQRILEIGCGTGTNLVALAIAFPKAEIVGLDLSKAMLDRAGPKLEKYGPRITLLNRRYDKTVAGGMKFDLILLSYSLSMMNPGFDEVLQHCRADLSPQGTVAVVDFHDSRWAWFRHWMGLNHVRMEGQVLDQLRDGFVPLICKVQSAFGGLWRYVLFIGNVKG
jgi:S-adenosylmethionine-diacylgycerolhomoserine-N-methlytransferase